MKPITSCSFFFSALISITCLSLQAQKLPNIQKIGVYAPADVKIDGRATEWHDSFEASNNATFLNYTIANDNKNLYLVVRATDGAAITKLMYGGFNLKISNGDKETKPVILAAMLINTPGRVRFSRFKEADIDVNETVVEFNDRLAANMKDIGVAGIKDIADSVISNFNEYDIKQAVRFNNNKALTYEIAIPLKYIKHLITDDTFKYNVTLPGMNRAGRAVGDIQPDRTETVMPDGSIVVSVVTKRVINGVDATADFQGLSSPTDFSGAYTLAKK